MKKLSIPSHVVQKLLGTSDFLYQIRIGSRRLDLGNSPAEREGSLSSLLCCSFPRQETGLDRAGPKTPHTYMAGRRAFAFVWSFAISVLSHMIGYQRHLPTDLAFPTPRLRDLPQKKRKRKETLSRPISLAGMASVTCVL